MPTIEISLRSRIPSELMENKHDRHVQAQRTRRYGQGTRRQLPGDARNYFFTHEGQRAHEGHVQARAWHIQARTRYADSTAHKGLCQRCALSTSIALQDKQHGEARKTRGKARVLGMQWKLGMHA